MAGHVPNPATKFETSTPMHSFGVFCVKIGEMAVMPDRVRCAGRAVSSGDNVGQ